MSGIPIDLLKFARDVFINITELNDKERAAYSAAESKARNAGFNVDELKGCVDEVAETLRKTLESVKAIDFGVDKEIGTDKTVFCVHGPNMGNYGDAEVAIVFKDEISRHPDAFLTPVAAMGYYQGWYIKNSRVGTDRPWAGEAKHWDRGAREDLNNNIYQSGTSMFSEACAMEWICRVVQNGRTGAGAARGAREVTLEDVQELWYNSDPHTAVEGHLPGFVPLECVERVYIRGSLEDAKSVCDGLKSAGVQCELVEDTKKVVWELMKTPRERDEEEEEKKEGYSFFVGGECRECTIPVDLAGSGARAVLFSTVNGGNTGDLMVTLSDKAFGSADRHCVTFKIPAFDMNAYAYNAAPADIIDKKGVEADRVGKSINFNANVFKPVTIFSINLDDKKVVFGHSGLSSLYNNETLSLPNNSYRFISFSSETYPLSVRYHYTTLIYHHFIYFYFYFYFIYFFHFIFPF